MSGTDVSPVLSQDSLSHTGYCSSSCQQSNLPLPLLHSRDCTKNCHDDISKIQGDCVIRSEELASLSSRLRAKFTSLTMAQAPEVAHSKLLSYRLILHCTARSLSFSRHLQCQLYYAETFDQQFSIFGSYGHDVTKMVKVNMLKFYL